MEGTDLKQRMYGRRCEHVETGLSYRVLAQCGAGYLVTPVGETPPVVVHWLPDVAMRFVREG